MLSDISSTLIGSPKIGVVWKAAIVVQGNYYHNDNITRSVFSHFLSSNSGDVLIICSTYPMDIILPYEQSLVDAGVLVFVFSTSPSKTEYPEFWATNQANQNLQRLTSYAGIQYAEKLGINYTLKIRSDSFLGKHEVIDYLIQQTNKYPLRDSDSLILKNRIVVSGQGTIVKDFWAPYHVRDHWYFGHTGDLLRFFDMSEKSSWKGGSGINVSCPESALTCVWMKDLGIVAKDTAELVSRFFIVEDAAEIEQVRLSKTPAWNLDYRKYREEGIPYLKTIYTGADPPHNVTTKAEWLSLLERQTLSPQPVTITTVLPRIHVASFASEGLPYDDGLPLGRQVLDDWGRLCLNGGATSFAGYTPRDLSGGEDAWSVTRYSDDHAMGMYHRVGLGAWRAVILNKTIKTAADGDVVVVHCANFPKYPCMKYFASKLRPYVEAVTKFTTDLYSPPHNHIAAYCGAEVLNHLIPEAELREITAHAPMGRGRLIIAQVNEKTRRFAQIFESVLKKNPLFLLSARGKTGYPGGGYHHHTAEQAVFNVLAFREGLFPRDWKNSWMLPLRNAGRLPACGTDLVIQYGADKNSVPANPKKIVDENE